MPDLQCPYCKTVFLKLEASEHTVISCPTAEGADARASLPRAWLNHSLSRAFTICGHFVQQTGRGPDASDTKRRMFPWNCDKACEKRIKDLENRVQMLEAQVSLLWKKEDKDMSKISTNIATVKAALLAEVARATKVQTDLQAKIAELQAKIDAADTPDPADVAALDELKAIADGLDPETPTAVPPAAIEAAADVTPA
jgi:hypothetical protein